MGTNVHKIENILIGEIWICAGQSNMEWPVGSLKSPADELSDSVYPDIRLFTVGRRVALQPQRELAGAWRQCDRSAVSNFSAVGFVCGRTLHARLKVPVGLIENAWDGTYGECWLSRSSLESNPKLKYFLDWFAEKSANYPERLRKFDDEMAAWNKARAMAHARGEPDPRGFSHPIGIGHKETPAGLFNGMVAPLAPFPVAGVLWYQGEGNAQHAYRYRVVLGDIIDDWRRVWKRPDLPFVIVQLPGYEQRYAPPGAWAVIREAQLQVLRQRNTTLVVTTDLGEAGSIHPSDKRTLGMRLATAVLGAVYREPGAVPSGPIYTYMNIEGTAVRLHFRECGSGLAVRGGDALLGFTVAGADRLFEPAQASIDGTTVVVGSDAVSHPIAVRYAWADDPVCTLCNRNGLPASPFRTDDWPVPTQNPP